MIILKKYSYEASGGVFFKSLAGGAYARKEGAGMLKTRRFLKHTAVHRGDTDCG
jgi:hypothetical protein